jgi:hypothetical protein
MDNALSVRVNNALLLAQAMGLDMTDPQQAQKVLRHLSLVEQYVGSDSND